MAVKPLVFMLKAWSLTEKTPSPVFWRLLFTAITWDFSNIFFAFFFRYFVNILWKSKDSENLSTRFFWIEFT